MTMPDPVSDRLGELTVEGDHATMTFRRHLPYPIERVWAAITDPLERKDWFGETVIDGRAGGSIEMIPTDPPAAPDAKRLTGRILVWDPPYVLEHEWHQRIVEDGIVRYELRPDGDGTFLTFTHTGLSEQNARGFIPGTHAFLDRLDAHLADAVLPEWADRYAELAPAYPSWR
jgi:uncharacterized protein YndB with AHSA1/START domain